MRILISLIIIFPFQLCNAQGWSWAKFIPFTHQGYIDKVLPEKAEANSLYFTAKIGEGTEIIKTDDQLNRSWTKYIQNLSVYDIESDSAANLYFVGSFIDSIYSGGFTLFSNEGRDAVIGKFNPNGTLLWMKKTSVGFQENYKSVSYSNKRVYVSGTIDSSDSDIMITQKFDESGNELAKVCIRGCLGLGLAAGDSSLFVTTGMRYTHQIHSFNLVKLDTTNLHVVWSMSRGSGFNYIIGLKRISADEYCLIGGHSSNTCGCSTGMYEILNSNGDLFGSGGVPGGSSGPGNGSVWITDLSIFSNQQPRMVSGGLREYGNNIDFSIILSQLDTNYSTTLLDQIISTSGQIRPSGITTTQMGTYVTGCLNGSFTYNNLSLSSPAYEQAFAALYSTSPTAIENENKDVFTVGPNPTTGLLTLTFPSEIIQSIKVYNELGQICLEVSELHNHQLDLSSLPGMIYFIEVTTEESRYRSKILVSHD